VKDQIFDFLLARMFPPFAERVQLWLCDCFAFFRNSLSSFASFPHGIVLSQVSFSSPFAPPFFAIISYHFQHLESQRPVQFRWFAFLLILGTSCHSIWDFRSLENGSLRGLYNSPGHFVKGDVLVSIRLLGFLSFFLAPSKHCSNLFFTFNVSQKVSRPFPPFHPYILPLSPVLTPGPLYGHVNTLA